VRVLHAFSDSTCLPTPMAPVDVYTISDYYGRLLPVIRVSQREGVEAVVNSILAGKYINMLLRFDRGLTRPRAAGCIISLCVVSQRGSAI
jgi:hypothetical protein